MAGLLFSHAKSIYNKAQKAKESWLDSREEDYEGAQLQYDTIIKIECNKFCKILNISEQLHSKYIELKNQNYNNYFITIRPRPEIKFIEFFNKVVKYIKRASFIEYRLSFEQKGCNEDDLGHSFHCHIVTLKSKWRSKGECLRDTISSFNKLCEPNCIQVEITKNPKELIQSYLIDYKSNDEHKVITKEMDFIWRNNNNLKDIYTEEDTLSPRKEPIKSGQVLSLTWG